MKTLAPIPCPPRAPRLHPPSCTSLPNRPEVLVVGEQDGGAFTEERDGARRSAAEEEHGACPCKSSHGGKLPLLLPQRDASSRLSRGSGGSTTPGSNPCRAGGGSMEVGGFSVLLVRGGKT